MGHVYGMHIRRYPRIARRQRVSFDPADGPPPSDPDLRVIVYTADVGSPSQEKLETLSALEQVADGPQTVG